MAGNLCDWYLWPNNAILNKFQHQMICIIKLLKFLPLYDRNVSIRNKMLKHPFCCMLHVLHYQACCCVAISTSWMDGLRLRLLDNSQNRSFDCPKIERGVSNMSILSSLQELWHSFHCACANFQTTDLIGWFIYGGENTCEQNRNATLEKV